MDRDKVTKPSSQCSFIGFVLLPLFEALGQLFPQLEVSPSDHRPLLPTSTSCIVQLAEKLPTFYNNYSNTRRLWTFRYLNRDFD